MSDDTETPIARIEKSRREHIRISLGTFKSRHHISVRIWFLGDDGVEKPSVKGANVAIERLDELVDAIIKARDEARAMGWIDETAAS